ncbi:glycosyltransferase [Candidatus Woesearchaeota archaeon]|nr:glycosyltransferase [Candidatus Woesearchaeota archaeon]
MAKGKIPEISIIIPVFNRPDLLDKCLKSVFSQDYRNFEVLVIDDGSTIGHKDVIKKYKVRYFYLEKNNGPGFARNFGAKEAKGRILIFIDSDVLASSGFLEAVKNAFETHREISALQGNYTLVPYYANFFSFFKNITLHYHFKKCSGRYSNSIASFCTAIKKDVFLDSHGFDASIRNASIEDEEFGIELTRRGHKILYDNSIQVMHMKKFNFKSLVRQDFRTGFDKIKSLLRKKHLFDARELKGSHSSFSLLASIPLSFIILFGLAMLVFFPISSLFFALIFLVGMFFLINIDYFLYMARKKGIGFSALAFFVSIINNSLTQIGIILGFVDFLLGKRY